MQPGVGASRTGHPDPGVQAVRRTGPAEQRALGFLRAIGQALQPGPLAQVQQVAAVLARQAGDGQAGRQVLGVFEADVGRSRRQAGRRGGGEGRPGALGGVFLAQRAGVVALRCECIEEALAVGAPTTYRFRLSSSSRRSTNASPRDSSSWPRAGRKSSGRSSRRRSSSVSSAAEANCGKRPA